MVDFSPYSAVLSSLKAAKDIAEGIVKLGKGEAFEGEFLEFQSKVIDANNAVWRIQEERTALLERIRELEKQVAQFEAWESEKQVRIERGRRGRLCLRSQARSAGKRTRALALHKLL